MSAGAVFGELAAQRRVVSTQLSHLSIELGHLYMEDFEQGFEAIAARFRRVGPWVDAVRHTREGLFPAQGTPRISTCFLIDDYFTRFSTPGEIVPMVIEAAAASGLTIDYLARESACARAGEVEPAKLVEDRLVVDPAPDTDGSRPPVTETGWLCNGQRSPEPDLTEAMGAAPAWRHPVQNAARRHSVFVDVELWDLDEKGERTWSCAFLASVWQLLRLGMLRSHGAEVLSPSPAATPYLDEWDALAPVTRLNEAAHPFSAYQTLSILPIRFLPIELAVRTILSQIAVDGEVRRQVAARSGAEGIPPADELVDRISYVFL
ncbi:SCO2522 family protein [Sphaerisporangium dianthi]|uniref:SCO2522 family protein n=1 Tax=Sphaerisporangium dianthi TaxID=1436120 RepID=A0ABV9CRK2_9ACTN